LRLEKESYEDAGLASFVEENFVPLNVHVKENPKNFRRFDAFWTPTVLILDPEGKERWRLEGYLPKDEFRADLEMGLGRLAFARKNWAEAEGHFDGVLNQFPDSRFAPQAIYYRGVSRYSSSHDHNELGNTAKTLAEKFPGNEWQLRSIPWASD